MGYRRTRGVVSWVLQHLSIGDRLPAWFNIVSSQDTIAESKVSEPAAMDGTFSLCSQGGSDTLSHRRFIEGKIFEPGEGG